jgi:hypothetical protein
MFPMRTDRANETAAVLSMVKVSKVSNLLAASGLKT